MSLEYNRQVSSMMSFGSQGTRFPSRGENVTESTRSTHSERNNRPKGLYITNSKCRRYVEVISLDIRICCGRFVGPSHTANGWSPC